MQKVNQVIHLTQSLITVRFNIKWKLDTIKLAKRYRISKSWAQQINKYIPEKAN